MPADELTALAERCDICGAISPTNAVLCSGCGANRAELAAATSRYRERQREALDARDAVLERERSDTVARKVAHGRQRLLAVLGASVLVLALAATGAVWVGTYRIEQDRIRQEQLAALAAAARACAEEGDQRCARDRYLTLFEQESDYPGARAGLVTARLGLARQLANARQWQEALDEVDAALVVDARNPDARGVGRTLMDEWINDSIRRADWGTFIRLRLDRDRRYP